MIQEQTDADSTGGRITLPTLSLFATSVQKYIT